MVKKHMNSNDELLDCEADPSKPKARGCPFGEHTTSTDPEKQKFFAEAISEKRALESMGREIPESVHRRIFAFSRDEPTGTSLREGSRSPWGEIQNVTHVADGISAVSTAGHGGLKLDKERNAEIPEPMRNSDGWYEEDTEATIVGWAKPEAFPHIVERRGETATRAMFDESVKNWYPDEYEKVTGETVTAEESYTRSKQLEKQSKESFKAANQDKFVPTRELHTHQEKWVPDNSSLVEAEMGKTGEKRYFLVPSNERKSEKMLGMRDDLAFDRDDYVDVTPVMNIKRKDDKPETVLRGNDVHVDTSDLTETQRNRADNELNKHYRFQNSDGSETIETLQENFQRTGVTGKRTFWDSGKKTTAYTIGRGNSRGTRVSKATYDAVQVPDTTDSSSEAHVKMSRAEQNYEKLRNEWRNADPVDAPDASRRVDNSRKRMEKSQEAYHNARQQEMMHNKMVSNMHQNERQDKFDRILEARQHDHLDA